MGEVRICEFADCKQIQIDTKSILAKTINLRLCSICGLANG